MTNDPLIVSFGGGANSTAMLIEMHRRGIMPNAILFADTGGERPETYDAVRRVSDWCKSRGMPGITTVSHKSAKHGDESLEDECLRSKTLPSIAYGFKRCSLKWKVAPQDKWANQWGPAKETWDRGLKVTKAIGYDAGEDRRAKIQNDDKYRYIYPLIEWQIYREDCVAICQSEGLPASKSSCFFCPSMKRREILDLRQSHPNLMKRALAMEANASEGLFSVAGLGRSFSWSDFLNNHDAQGTFDFGDDNKEIPCGCYDGGSSE